jgi:hypothetical protein
MRKMYWAIGLLATLLTVGLAFGVLPLVSNHLTGTSLPERILTLTGNMTDVTTYIGDTFFLTATLSGLTDRYITFYCNSLPIGGVTSTGGIATISYYCMVASWDFYATAEY